MGYVYIIFFFLAMGFLFYIGWFSQKIDEQNAALCNQRNGYYYSGRGGSFCIDKKVIIPLDK